MKSSLIFLMSLLFLTSACGTNTEKTKEEAEEQEQLRLEAEAKLAEKAEAKKQALAALGLSQEVVNLLAE